jgi:hypothetical protein
VLFAFVAPAAVAADAWWTVSHRLAPAGSVDFTPHGTQPGLSYDLQVSDQCASCHSNNGDPEALAFRPYSSWSGSMMANATRDPLFWAALDVANNDAPGSGDFCLRCHTPRGWLDGRVVKPGFNPLPGTPEQGASGCLLRGDYDSPDDINSDFGGLSCHFCHRMMPEGPNGEPGYTENASIWIDDAPCTNTGEFEPCRRGPYDYTDGAGEPPHPWDYSEYHTQSAICGSCHNVTSPDTGSGPLKTLKLADGFDTGIAFPIERTFAEWQRSAYPGMADKQCQNCHMPQAEDPNASACSFGGNRAGNLAVHEFVGGNTWIPGIIKGQYANGLEQGGPERAASFDQTIQWARDLLGTAAEVETMIQSYTPPGGGAGSMAVRVKVTNHSGHKLPSGYGEGRRMWLNLQVKDAKGALVFESAAYDSATAELGVDAQARVYEVLQGIFDHNGTDTCDVSDAAGDPMFHFVLNDCVAKDNRIPPAGFKPSTIEDPNGYEVAPVPAGIYPETMPGSGILVNYDTVDYAVPVPVGTLGPLTATARLYYQTSSKEYIEFLRDEALANATEAENLMCTGAPERPFTIGPQGKTRGEYVYGLWSGAIFGDRVFTDGFDSPGAMAGYGKSPPELLGTAAATTP